MAWVPMRRQMTCGWPGIRSAPWDQPATTRRRARYRGLSVPARSGAKVSRHDRVARSFCGRAGGPATAEGLAGGGHDGHVQTGWLLHTNVTAFLLARGANPLRQCSGITVVTEAETCGQRLAAEIMRGSAVPRGAGDQAGRAATRDTLVLVGSSPHRGARSTGCVFVVSGRTGRSGRLGPEVYDEGVLVPRGCLGRPARPRRTAVVMQASKVPRPGDGLARRGSGVVAAGGLGGGEDEQA
jgi:hypothetical protein